MGKKKIKKFAKILNYNTGKDVDLNYTRGFAKGSFLLHLDDGSEYEVKKGYKLDWSDEKWLSIKELAIRDDVESYKNNKLENTSGIGDFFETMFNSVAMNWIDDETATEVDFKWKEIDFISRIRK